MAMGAINDLDGFRTMAGLRDNLVSDELKKKIKIKDECQQLIYIPNMKGSFIKTDHVVMPRKPRP